MKTQFSTLPGKAKTKLLSSLVMSLTLLAASQSSFAVHVELGDAGDLPLTAQATGGGGPLPSITGSLLSLAGAPSDVDMYCIYIADGAAFSAMTVSLFDTQLFLFDCHGVGVQGNDDGNPGLQALLDGPPNLDTLAPGIYYLAISGFDNDPLDSGGGLIFPTTPFLPQYGPIDGDSVASWSGGGGGGAYEILLTGAEASPCRDCASVPEFGPGLAGFGLVLLGMGALKGRLSAPQNS